MTLAKKVKELREERKMTQGQLATYSGLERSYISLIESGKRESPLASTLDKLAKGLRVDPVVLYQAAGMLPDDLNIQISANKYEVPIYGVIFAGSPQGAEQDIQGKASVPDEIVKECGLDNLIALKISGDSMNKIVPEGAIAIFNTKYEPIQNGHIYGVLIDDSEATLKRVYKYDHSIRFETDSFNKDLKPWTYTDDMDTQVNYIGELVYIQMNTVGL